MHSDPVADLLARIRNGCSARMTSVEIPHSKLKLEIVKLLAAEGYLKEFEVTTETRFPTIRVQLRYDSKRNPIIRRIKRVSKPGLRVYEPFRELNPLRSGLGTRILSTSQGVMTDRDARRKHIGGEVLCEVW